MQHQLDAARVEINKLRQRLHRKDQQCLELQDEVELVSAQVLELEEQCRDRSAKAAELMEILGAKTPDAIGEKLLEKGLQNAEFSQQLSNLRQRLQDTERELETANRERKKTKKSMSNISQKNDKLTQKLKDVEAENEHLTKQRETYKPLILELGNVVRSLNTISVTYTKVEKDSNAPLSAAEAQVHSLRNIKRKVEAIEKERKLFINENDFLREELETKNKQILALEQQYHLLNSDRLDKGDTESLAELSARGRNNKLGDSHSGPHALQGGAHESKKMTEETCQFKNVKLASEASTTSSSSSCCSDASSCSSIEPPSIALEKYEKLRHEHQTALFKVAELEDKLQTVAEDKHKAGEEAQSKLAGILERYPGAAQALAEMQPIYAESLQKSHQVGLQYEKLKRDYDDALNDHISQYKKFKEDFQTHDQRCRIFEEVRMVAFKKHMKHCDQLAKKHEISHEIMKHALDKLERNYEASVRKSDKQNEQIKLEYTEALEVQARKAAEIRADVEKEHNEKFQKLTEEFNKSLERNSELEREHASMIKNSEEKIQNLIMARKQAEDEATAKLQRVNQQYKEDLEERMTLESELRDITKKAEQRAKAAYDKLKEEYDLSEDDRRKKDEEIFVLRQQVEENLSPDLQDALKGYERLKLDRDSKAARLSTQESKLQHKYEEENLPDTTFTLEKISMLEDELLGEADDLKIDSARRTHEDRFNRFKSDFIIHLHQLRRVHDSIFPDRVLTETVTRTQGIAETNLMDYLLHQQKMRHVSHALTSYISSENQNQVKMICDDMENEIEKVEPDCDSLGSSTETILLSIMEEGGKAGQEDIANNAPGFQDNAIFRSGVGIPSSLNICKMLSDMSSISQSISHADVHEDADYCCLPTRGEKLTTKELNQYLESAKVQISSLRKELNRTKEMAVAAQKEKEVHAKFLREVISQYRALEGEHRNVVEKVKSRDTSGNEGLRTSKDLQSDLKAVICQYRVLEKEYKDLLESKQQQKPDKSTTNRNWCSPSCAEDPSVATGITTADMRDSHSAYSNGRVGGGERDGRPNIETKGSTDDYHKLRQEHDAAMARISTIEKELEDARKITEASKKQQASRERHLKDVISQYKKLESERDALVEELQGSQREPNSHATGCQSESSQGSQEKSKPTNGEDVAARKIAEIEKELQEARKAAEVARMKQAERDTHLRDVIYHYKKLQMEHADLASQVTQMKGKLDESDLKKKSMEEKGQKVEKNGRFDFLPKKVAKRQTSSSEPEIRFV